MEKLLRVQAFAEQLEGEFCRVAVLRIIVLQRWTGNLQGPHDLRLGQTAHGIEMPKQIAGFSAGIHHMLDEGPPQRLGGGSGQLALADPRFAANEQGPGRGQRGVDRHELFRLEMMARLERVMPGGKVFDVVDADGEEFHETGSG